MTLSFLAILQKVDRLESLATLQEAYHYTDTRNLKNILHHGKFRLASPVSGESDRNHINKPYFLSMTRSKIGHYTKKNDRGAVFNLNTDHLRNHHKISQVDYWGPNYRKHNPTGNEMEERVHSDKSHITIPKPATKLIKSIHVLHPKPSKYDTPEHIAHDNENLRHSLILAKKHKIPIHVYDDKQHWLHQRTDKAIPISQLDLKGSPKPSRGYDSSKYDKRDIGAYLKLYHGNTKSRPKYGSPEHHVLQGIHYYPNDAKTGLETVLHNTRKSEISHKLTNLVHKHGGIKSFLDHLKQKHSD